VEGVGPCAPSNHRPEQAQTGVPIAHFLQDEIIGSHALVARRKARRKALASQPVFWLAAAGRRVNEVDGLGCPVERLCRQSPESARGPARIVRDSSEFGKLQPGDVLVAPVINPAWTPLFQHAAAVVVNTGGSASHAAITAHKYGVPAVMGSGFKWMAIVVWS
jgi:phosphohistidine swiveling domain-containing protein